MRSVVLYLPVFVSLVGCSIFGGRNTVSDWKVLENAASLECEVFPRPKPVLRVRDLYVLEGKTSGLVADVILRTGQRGTYFSRFDSSPEVDVEAMVKRDFGSGSLILGGAGIDKGTYVALLQSAGGKSKLELRTLPDNIIRFSSNEIPIQAMSGKAYFTKHGVWLAYKVDANDVAENDAEVGVVFFKFGKQGKLIARNFAKHKFPSGARLLVSAGDRQALIVWGAEGKSAAEFRFYLSELNPAKLQAEEPKPVELPVSTEVESWAATAQKDGMLIAYVDGDSLVGQAKLKISRVYWRREYTKVAWKREESLTNIHVSEPVWLTVGRGAKLMIPKWVDGESTIGLYTVSPDGAIKPAVAGIFPKGSRVMTGFRDVEENDNYGVVRYRHKGAWQFEICNLEDI